MAVRDNRLIRHLQKHSGIRKTNDLKVEKVVFQTLSLRQSTMSNSLLLPGCTSINRALEQLGKLTTTRPSADAHTQRRFSSCLGNRQCSTHIPSQRLDEIAAPAAEHARRRRGGDEAWQAYAGMDKPSLKGCVALLAEQGQR